MKLTRMSGAGNSFFIIDEISFGRKIPADKRAHFVKYVCSLFQRSPTDGLLFISKKEGFDFVWDFFNSDGSSAEMCGNAARCATQYFLEQHVSDREIRSKEISFLTLSGPVHSKVLHDHRVEIKMPIVVGGMTMIEGHFFVNTGVPHIVVDSEPDLQLAQRLRPHPTPRGSNITFVSSIDPQNGTASAITFERGVEAWTPACGTGAVAAGIYLFERFSIKNSKIKMPGGLLEVDYEGAGSVPVLRGQAQFDYLLELDEIEILKQL